ncbi:MAG: hypothetical protein ABIE43_00425 [Patescibacteria group bacterium]
MFDISRYYNIFTLGYQKFFSSVFYLISFFYIRIYLIISIGLNLFLWLASYLIKINVSQDLIVLHYNVDFGVDFIGGVEKIYTIPFLGLIIITINIILLFSFSRHDNFKFISNLLLATGAVVNIFLLINLASIYLINFR